VTETPHPGMLGRPDEGDPGGQPVHSAEVVEEEERPDQGSIQHPTKLLRIASMIRELVEEVRQAPLDERGRSRIREVYARTLGELKGLLSPDLQAELAKLMTPLEEGASDAEIRVAQAQLLGWLEGLFHGIQAALWSQQMQARAALEEMRRRGLPSGDQSRPSPSPEGGPPGQYL
jgi:hypothetical protein